MNPATPTISTPLLIAALVAFAWPLLVHEIEASGVGSKIPESMRPKLAAVGGLLVGALQAIAQSQDWHFLLFSALVTGTAGVGGISAPSGSIPGPRLARRSGNGIGPAAIVGAVALSLGLLTGSGCKVEPVTAGAVAGGIATALCGALDIVPLLVPGNSGVVIAGTACHDVAPYVSPIVTGIVSRLEAKSRDALAKKAATESSYASFSWKGKPAGRIRSELCGLVANDVCVDVQKQLDALATSAVDGGAK